MSADSYTALIKLVRVLDKDLMFALDGLDPDEDLFQRGAIEFNPVTLRKDGRIPVLCNHDKTRPIGYVRDLSHFEDGHGTWLVAHTTITDRPCWLERDTAASIGYSPLVSRRLGPTRRVLKGWLTEVTVLAPGRKPHNTGAKVMRLRKAEPTTETQLGPKGLVRIEDRVSQLAAQGIVCRPARITAVY